MIYFLKQIIHDCIGHYSFNNALVQDINAVDSNDDTKSMLLTLFAGMLLVPWLT